jgi:hypothetical protein
MYDIIPPMELRADWDKIKKQQITTTLATQKNNWKNIDNYFLGLSNWWNQNIQYLSPKPVAIPIAKQKNKNNQVVVENKNENLEEVVVVGVSENQRQQRSVGYSTTAAAAGLVNPSTALQGKVSGVQISSASINSGGSYKLNTTPPSPQVKSIQFTPPIVKKDETVVIRGARSLQSDAAIDDNTNSDKSIINNNADSISANYRNYGDGDIISTNTWSPDRSYLKVLKAAATEKKYTTYLELRENEINNPNFYFDVAHYFYDRGDKEKALLILSNIADLGSENHQLYKTLSFTLRQWQATEDAVFTTKKIALWRSHEPQIPSCF